MDLDLHKVPGVENDLCGICRAHGTGDHVLVPSSSPDGHHGYGAKNAAVSQVKNSLDELLSMADDISHIERREELVGRYLENPKAQ